MKRTLKSCITKYSLLALLVLVGSFFSCTEKDSSASTILAKYKGESLSLMDIRQHIPRGLSKKDSTRFANNYIASWRREQVLVANARKLINNIADKTNYKVEDYRRTAIIQELRQKVIDDKLNEYVSESEINEYYQKNKAIRSAINTLYLYYYVKTSNPDTPKLTKRLKSNSYADKKIVENWCLKHAESYKINNQYLESSTINKIESETGNLGLRNLKEGGLVHVYTSFTDGEKYIHFFYMKSVIRAGRDIPLSSVKERIRNIIINKRKLELIESFENDLINKAKANNELE